MRLGRSGAGSGRYGACAAAVRRYTPGRRQPPARAHLVVLDRAQQLTQRRRQRRDEGVRGADRLLVRVLVLQVGYKLRMPQLGRVEQGASLRPRQIAVLERTEQRRVLGPLDGGALHRAKSGADCLLRPAAVPSTAQRQSPNHARIGKGVGAAAGALARGRKVDPSTLALICHRASLLLLQINNYKAPSSLQVRPGDAAVGEILHRPAAPLKPVASIQNREQGLRQHNIVCAAPLTVPASRACPPPCSRPPRRRRRAAPGSRWPPAPRA